MDVHGGRGICMGPSNYLGRTYQSIPVAITVEGANILTRSMMIFGQGAMRCHPYLQDEIAAASMDDRKQAIEAFDTALMSHLAYTFANGSRAMLYGLTGGLLADSPVAGQTARYFKQINRFSAAFSVMADLALLTLGGALKRKESISGRFADALAYMYLACAVLKRFEDNDRPEGELPLVHWSCRFCLYQVQQALDGIIRNFPLRPVAWKMRALVFPLGRHLQLPDDRLAHQVAELLIEPSQTRDELVAGIYQPGGETELTGRLHHAMQLTLQAEPIERRLRESGKVYSPDLSYEAWVGSLVESRDLDIEEAEILHKSRQAVRNAVMVDDFPGDEWGKC